ncbi:MULTISPECIES: DUF2314 domain-containing protein [Ralstonia solanacearum species complex]|uniref:DUF2314 domain-containing protein n=1 Tax=Ralstonia solanacearum species complex TaxID=3116862 RepID=UPI0018D1F5B9|nr:MULTISPECIES: DUF2314 domain-containing protein [Ralstonia solanacearum species complex]MDN3368261.1 DUF2314 domain-containing protein [Ralstonia pseudosolanacearum]
MSLAEIGRDGWELDDAEVIAKEHPATFWLPERQRRESLVPGDIVKLIFRIRTVDDAGCEEINVERMWVTTEGIDGGLYLGRLDNNPLCTPDMAAGFKLRFQARHVIGIWDSND